jgi:predicted metalloprotease with PDZ domain
MLGEDAFLAAVNLEARECYASVRRHLTMREATPLFFSDFLAHRLPYARGMFYLADLDARLKTATSGQHGVDDVVRDLMSRRRAGESVGIEQWCARVQEVLPDERPALEAMVHSGVGRPGERSFGTELAMRTTDVPVLDLGFDASTLVTRRVRGLVPGGAADRVGLREGETIDVPSYPEIVRMNAGDDLHVGVTRDGEIVELVIPLVGETAPVPQWCRE